MVDSTPLLGFEKQEGSVSGKKPACRQRLHVNFPREKP